MVFRVGKGNKFGGRSLALKPRQVKAVIRFLFPLSREGQGKVWCFEWGDANSLVLNRPTYQIGAFYLCLESFPKLVQVVVVCGGQKVYQSSHFVQTLQPGPSWTKCTECMQGQCCSNIMLPQEMENQTLISPVNASPRLLFLSKY